MTPTLKSEDRKIRYLDQDQVARLFKAAGDRPARDRLMLALMYRFGLRTQEVCELPAKNVDLERWELAVTGMKNGLHRVYTIPRDLRPLFRAYAKERDKTVAQWFTGRRGRLHRVRVYLIFKECLRAAGLRADLGAHALRHAAAMAALDAGLSTEEVRDLLRHRRISSTDVYANLSTRRRGDYLRKLEESSAVVKLR